MADAQAELGADFLLRGRDGASRHVIELKERLNAVRELHAAITQLAVFAGRLPELERAWLLIRQTKLTVPRLQHEWGEVLRVLRPELAGKLAGVAISSRAVWKSDSGLRLPSVERWVERCTMGRDTVHSEVPLRVHPVVPTAKFFDVWKVLLSAWLQKEGALAVHTVAERAGAAYPTVAEALKRLEHRGEVRRRSDRSVELRGWPRKTYGELESLLPALRKTAWFVDRSGRAPDSAQLLRRLRKLAVPQVALGGVEAARHLDPSLDLLGTPRVDLTVHAPNGAADLGFVREIDPALTPTDAEGGTVLAVHLLTRQQSLFVDHGAGLPLADPAEVALDLGELRLTSQLFEFVQHFGGRS